MNSWQWLLNRWDCVKGREVKWGEENSWLLCLSWFRNCRTFSFFFFFFLPKLGANGKAVLCLPECSQCIQFPVQRARSQKQKQTGSEGRGKWEVTEVRAWRAQMGNGGRMWGGEARRWKTHMVLVTNCYAFHVSLFQTALQLYCKNTVNEGVKHRAARLIFQSRYVLRQHSSIYFTKSNYNWCIITRKIMKTIPR